ncbi:glycosyltransferase family 2 protein [Lederbergia wuyishanensis]|uniref:Glycosyltransferase involved in cell wall biosynthesis n=1 Tax=Lederbergia wuyishanensis TaxID=1347903 RepID=A0ABU0D7V9_9BACI|nr:glycosyltransferase family 2 protein [Lederbergia wuyishanensis]MCJ8009119.1 glycosyltransferase family 2 protein [Lederbergia wuyishanensis]MDQ0344458.1 glycosyltransferase involved in cell wall biosynthesis [Lederbergia wuyishanensis]
MKILTIFTPTYNRAYCLEVCYKSLVNQTCKDFSWLIIDDGSTDKTKELVESWQYEDLIEIVYHWQENKGMHGAHNTAYEMIQTELNVCIDSDDYMPEKAVENIVNFWRLNGNKNVSGIIGLDSYSNGKVIGTKLPTNIKSSTLFDLYNKYRVTGDKKLVYRTELTKMYQYPVFINEKYVGLNYKYYMLDKNFELLLMNEVLCCVEYLPDGSSLNMLQQYRRNPKGFAFYRKELMNLPFATTSFKFRQAIHFVSSNMLMKNNFLKDSPNKWITILASPLGVLLYCFILLKTRGKIMFN